MIEAPANVAVATHVQIEQRNAAVIATLDRPSALNAIDDSMRASLSDIYPRAARDPNTYAVVIQSSNARAFCAGGDVKALLAIAREDIDHARRILHDEYQFNWLHECFSKPSVPLMDGRVMGSGVGISSYATHRVAAEGYAFAMPETAIGFFPDVGSAWLLSRLPWPVGLYLGLTGETLRRADALRMGLVTHCISASEFPGIVAALSEAEPVDPLLDDLHADPGPGELVSTEPLINKYFSRRSLKDIVAALGHVDPADSAWAQATLAKLRARSPLALAVTDRHIREARTFDLRAVLQRDYRLASRFLMGLDFHEGVRAALIDKDHSPRWAISRIEDVTEGDVDTYFAWMGRGEMILPTRREMQELRV